MPSPPPKPVEIVETTFEISIDEGYTLADYVDKFQKMGISLDKVRVIEPYNYPYWSYPKTIPNTNYEKELKAYPKLLEIHKKNLESYRKKLVQWNAEEGARQAEHVTRYEKQLKIAEANLRRARAKSK